MAASKLVFWLLRGSFNKPSPGGEGDRSSLLLGHWQHLVEVRGDRWRHGERSVTPPLSRLATHQSVWPSEELSTYRVPAWRRGCSRNPALTLLWRSSLTCQDDVRLFSRQPEQASLGPKGLPDVPRSKGSPCPQPLSPRRAWRDAVRSEEDAVQTEEHSFALLCRGVCTVTRLPRRGCCLL